jgi:hypothetical protein
MGQIAALRARIAYLEAKAQQPNPYAAVKNEVVLADQCRHAKPMALIELATCRTRAGSFTRTLRP